ncbi:globin domain-containing protein [Crocosphaera sp. XPORK-15E]|uniref:globin domain-containing protein n=1 Tax=Crocosphaera sp. XPORK-15E TaxID=3110247 RepID=UPI002B1F3A22|nr:globin domain-containing protein [Crocosphaera sp. XPORK-15E]MEA5536479.1 globin domain-containing protein [Crocosphaera sp. XPORK-15E]
MVSQKTIEIVKKTAPVLKEKGTEITIRMYELMFSDRPEYKLGFETSFMQHLDGGSQPGQLAASVYAYATHIDKLDELAAAVEHIAHRHTNSRVIAEQYPVVGKFLLAAMKDVLQDAATPEIMAAWEEAYYALAEVFINREQAIYQEDDQKLREKLEH